MTSTRLSLVETLILGGFASLSTLVLAAGCGGSSSTLGEDMVGTGGIGTGSGGLASGGAFASGGSVGADGLVGAGGAAATGGAPGTGGNAPVACPDTVLPAGDTTRTVSVGGKTRSYVLHVPANPNPETAVPLLVDFHPLGGSGPGQRGSSPYPAQTDGDGVVIAFPSGESGPSGGAWNVGPCCVAGTDDVEFARALVTDVQSVTCIDPKRIYASGFSMGGGMTHYLGCHAADLFAAIAPAAFDLLEENIDDCAPSRPLTVVAFRGTNDFVVPYEGGDSSVVAGMPITFLGAEATFAEWAEFDGCTGSPVDVGNGCERYESCQAGVTVTLCTKSGGNHEQGNASIAWPILKQHALP